jgi:hypothetical protein
VGTPVQFQRCMMLVIAMANKTITLTAGKFVPVSKATIMNVIITFYVNSQYKHVFRIYLMSVTDL